LGAYPEWIAQLRKVRHKKFGDVPPAAPERQRQARFLSYRGFTSAQIRTALGFDTDLGFDTNLDSDAEDI
jgi:regulatory protein